MLTRINKQREDRESGFTLIELLVVVAIIAILAVIAIPIFNSLRDSAASTAAESDIRNAVTTIEVYYTQEGSFPAKDGTSGAPVDAAGDALEISFADDTALYYTQVGSGADFTLAGCSTAVPDGQATWYEWSSATGSFSSVTEESTCTTDGTAGGTALASGWN